MLKTNIVYHNNCVNLLNDIDDNSIDLIIIDPPYNDKGESVNDNLSEQLFRILKETGNLYIWCTIGQTDQSLIRWFPIFNYYFYFKDLITWKKERGIGMKKGWLHVIEEIMWFVKNNKKFIWNKNKQYDIKSKRSFSTYKNLTDYRRWTNIWIDINDINRSLGKNDEVSRHPFQKPLKALKRIIALHTKKDDLILDCFAGSGSTGIAAKQMNRNFILIEKEKNHYDSIVKILKEEL